MLLNSAIKEIKKIINRIDFDKYFNWFIQKFNLVDKSKNLNNKKVNHLHPIRPRKGEIYLIEPKYAKIINQTFFLNFT